MKFHYRKWFGALAMVAVFSACSHREAPEQAAVKPVYDSVAALARIRASAAQFDSAVQVHPLRDAAVEGLLKQAHAAEDSQQIDQALTALADALKIARDAPDILQYQAELSIQKSDWKQAAAQAQHSYDLGPKVGALCARNLQTLIETRTALGDIAGAGQVQLQLPSCQVPAPVRL